MNEAACFKTNGRDAFVGRVRRTGRNDPAGAVRGGGGVGVHRDAGLQPLAPPAVRVEYHEEAAPWLLRGVIGAEVPVLGRAVLMPHLLGRPVSRQRDRERVDSTDVPQPPVQLQLKHAPIEERHGRGAIGRGRAACCDAVLRGGDLGGGGAAGEHGTAGRLELCRGGRDGHGGLGRAVEGATELLHVEHGLGLRGE